tara:strand:+ start:25 stop:555 length:531 start_codon:yes stop_codon:yes gene_type:complete
MNLTAQLWGSTNERIHTLGTLSLALSAVFFLSLETTNKNEGLLIFTTFGFGVVLIGVATLKNSWGRWRYGSDTLILLRKTGDLEQVHLAAVIFMGWYIAWCGKVAHVDCGKFTLRSATSQDTPTSGSVLKRSYIIFRAGYWMGCSSIVFQTLFGLCAVGYGVWLLKILFIYERTIF